MYGVPGTHASPELMPVGVAAAGVIQIDLRSAQITHATQYMRPFIVFFIFFIVRFET
jgi:hypothetical protein